MELEQIVNKAREARGSGKYLLISYNGTYRDVYPMSLRTGPGGVRMYAWCTLHPNEVSEAFLISKIMYCTVSETDALFIPSGVEEF